jgi:hypothetical protein
MQNADTLTNADTPTKKKKEQVLLRQAQFVNTTFVSFAPICVDSPSAVEALSNKVGENMKKRLVAPLFALKKWHTKMKVEFGSPRPSQTSLRIHLFT